MAEDLTARTAPIEATERALPPATDERRESSPAPRRSVFRSRFAIAYLALAVVAGAALGVTALLLLDPPEKTTDTWSSWKPTGRESSYPAQIADHVSDRYRLPSGNPLVGIIAGRPQVQTREGPAPVEAVAIQEDPEGTSDDISIVPTENSVMYTLCGLGPQCSIREGTPSRERGRLLRREALELALYSFKYVKDLSSVIALMPTNLGSPTDPSDDTSTALFFQKRDLEPQLEIPLQRTLLSPRPPQAAEIGPFERNKIDVLTEHRLYRYQFTQTQAGGFVIVLAPVPAT